MLRSFACDAGGILVASGAIKGTAPAGAEFVALDWSTITVGRFLAARYEGRPATIRIEIELAIAMVTEWFPVRPIVAGILARAGSGAVDSLDSWSALILAERLHLPLFTASEEVTSTRTEVRRPW